MKRILSCSPIASLLCVLLFIQSFILWAHEDPDRRKKKSEGEDKKSQLEQFKDEDDEEDDDDDNGGSFWTEFFLQVGWEFSKFLLFSPSLDSTGFVAYPYAQGEYGLAVLDAPKNYRSGFGQIQMAYHYIDHDLYGLAFSFRGRLNDIAGINLEVSNYREDRFPESDVNMLMIRLGLMKSLLIREQLIWDLDLGFRTVDEIVGFDAGMRWQLFPKPPFSLDLWASAGSMNRSFFMELKPMVGIAIGRFQWDLGFRYLKWGDEDLHGVIGGMRIWF